MEVPIPCCLGIVEPHRSLSKTSFANCQKEKKREFNNKFGHGIMNRQLIDIGKVVALIGGLLSIVETILDLLSIQFAIGNTRAFIGLDGLFGVILILVLNIVIVLICTNRIEIRDLTVLGVVVLVLALVGGNIISILGGVLILLGVFLN